MSPPLDSLLPSLDFPKQPPKPFVAQLTISPATTCPTAVPGLKIRFPAASLEVTNSMGQLRSACGLLQDKLTPLMQAIMTALKPIFDLIDLAQKILNCITAIPDAITNLNPDPVLKCIPDLANKLAEILAYLFPPIAVPPFIADLLCVLKTVCECVLQQIEAIIAFEKKLESVARLLQTKGNEFLQTAHNAGVVCRSSLVENMTGSLKPVEPLIKIANSLGSLVPNFPAIPSLGDLTGLPLDKIETQIQTFQALLGQIPDTCVMQ